MLSYLRVSDEDKEGNWDVRKSVRFWFFLHLIPERFKAFWRKKIKRLLFLTFSCTKVPDPYVLSVNSVKPHYNKTTPVLK